MLSFGEFQLKSGRTSPYFFNAGLISGGTGLARLGEFYRAAIEDSGIAFDVLFGPAYKGIPLVTSTAIAFSQTDRDIKMAYNRKEVKDHGEGGMLVGAPVEGKVLLIDDVITAGTAIREVLNLLHRQAECEVVGAVVAIDRQERGTGDRSAIDELQDEYGVQVTSIVKLDDVIEFLRVRQDVGASWEAVHRYRETYGAAV